MLKIGNVACSHYIDYQSAAQARAVPGSKLNVEIIGQWQA
jgi:hypothetical protein